MNLTRIHITSELNLIFRFFENVFRDIEKVCRKFSSLT